MKILLVSSSSGSRGGGEFYLLGLAKGLSQLGHDVQILMSRHPIMDEFAQSCAADGVSVERFAYRNTYHRRLRVLGASWDHAASRSAAESLRAFQPDIVHINLQCVEDGLDLLEAGRLCGLPCVATIHVTRSMQELGASLGWLRDRIARRAIVRSGLPLVGISQVSASDLATYIGGSLSASGRDDLVADRPNRVHSVPNGVAAANRDNRQKFRAEWGIADYTFLLGCIARLEAQKNPGFIVPLMQQLPANAHLVWIGDGRLREQTEQACREAGLSDRITFDGWRSDATDRMGAFDAFVLPSLYEGLPLAILEAMSAAIPTVVSDVDGTRDAVLDGQTGFLCPVNDVPAWSEKLQQLMASPELVEQMSVQAQQRYHDEFSLEAMASRTIAVYEDVLQKFQCQAEQVTSA
ncbi:MAG: glycosyltransferase family 4 protein [Planctomycetaceae bacterium]|nr:glycosyltransferase family 4 protein [Planctomycetaceae bacterium]